MRELDFVDEYYADKDLSLLKKLTIVIPTYNRNYYLSRCLWYHAHFPFGEIIVADSSPETIKAVNRKTIMDIANRYGTKIRYLEYEPETEMHGGDIYRKWADAVQHVDTEYTQICTDKEFLVPLTLCACISYLQTHPDYTVADGRHYHLEQDSHGTYLYRDTPTVDIHSTDSWSRLVDMTNNPGCTLLALHRTDKIQTAYHSLIENSVSDIRFGEIYLELQDIILGKAMSLTDSVLLYRDTITFEQTLGSRKLGESSSFRYPQIWDYTSSDYNRYYSNFRKGILASLENSSTFDKIGFADDIDEILQRFISRRMGTAHPLRKLVAVRKMFYYLPKKIQSIILTTIMSGYCSIGDYSPKTLDLKLGVKIITDTITSYPFGDPALELF